MSDLFDGTNAAPEEGEATERLEVADRFLDGSSFTRVSLKDALVADSILTGARVDDADATGMVFENVRLARARFHDVNLSGATIDHADLTGLAITDAKVDGMTIDGVSVTAMLAKWRGA